VISFFKIKEKVSDFVGLFSWDIGVDLGSNNTLIYLRERGVIIDEPTMLARQKKKRWTGLSAPKTDNKRPIAFGLKAKSMWNREPRQIEVISPIKNGIISDLEGLESLIIYYLKLVYEVPSKYPKIFKPRVIVGVPSCINQVQKRAVKSVFVAAGAREVILVEEVILASVGLNLPIDNSSGLVVVDVGGGKTEVSVVSMGGVVVGKGIKTAGTDLDNAIVNYVKMKYGLLIGLSSAEKIKIENNNEGLVRGRDLETGLPKSIKLSQGEVREAISLEIGKIVKLVATVLDETPPELMEDILKKGIILVGNGSKIKGLAELIETETKICTRVADDAGLAVIKGCGQLVENKKMLKQIRLVSILK
jgi:rod shape-determining protein MreB